jgi:cyanophycinase-like exopeptidase
MHTAGHAPGTVALLGSGETSLVGGRVFESLVQARANASPLRVAVLETPAGFEPNSDRVAGRVADFLALRLGSYHPEVTVIAARQRGTRFSPDDSGITAPLLSADLIFMGPGSPTYAVRQLQDSLAWRRVIARQRAGATLVFASAAVIAIGACALPVYEIYKAGHDLHWHAGLNLFGAYGLRLVFVPHWNNAEGGAELDTSRCFVGQARFEMLQSMLPRDVTVVGIDEHTALAMALANGTAAVMGAGDVTVAQGSTVRTFSQAGRFSLAELGPFALPDPSAGPPPAVCAEALAAREADQPRQPPPADVSALITERQAARERRDWATADALRRRITSLGWQVCDTPAGPVVEALPH